MGGGGGGGGGTNMGEKWFYEVRTIHYIVVLGWRAGGGGSGGGGGTDRDNPAIVNVQRHYPVDLRQA